LTDYRTEALCYGDLGSRGYWRELGGPLGELEEPWSKLGGPESDGERKNSHKTVITSVS